MALPPKKAGAAKGSKERQKGTDSLYTFAGSKLERKNKSCPKCGAGTFLAEHSNRKTCGKCGYTEFRK